MKTIEKSALRIVSFRPGSSGMRLWLSRLSKGDQVYLYPGIVFQANEPDVNLLASLRTTANSYVVFTSPRAVTKALFPKYQSIFLGHQLLAVGQTTQEKLKAYGLDAAVSDLKPGLHALVQSYQGHLSDNWHLIGGPKSSASQAVIQAIQRCHGTVDYYTVYDSMLATVKGLPGSQSLLNKRVDVIVILSEMSLRYCFAVIQHHQFVGWEDAIWLVSSDRIKQLIQSYFSSTVSVFIVEPYDFFIEKWLDECYHTV
ncbi:MAG: hypothetical protein CMF46_04865 [Legionellales bacterium]|nr:hypothetical protein [Legionellales bacterium]|tara:strand:- start:1624 stop:2391 length:768 start_codon:yes stop_codon:yes gene_type:complete